MEINPIVNSLNDIQERTVTLKGYLEYDVKKDRLEEVSRELEDPNVWNDPDYAQKLGKERSTLEAVVSTIDELISGVDDTRTLR